jgi:hypothetical protein
MYTETLTQRIGLAAGSPPVSLSNNRQFTDAVDMSKFHRAIFIVSIGASVGSWSAWLQEDNSTAFSNSSNDTAGTFSNSGGSNVSLTGQTTASKEYTFEVRADQLSPGNKFVRLETKENNVGATLICVTAYGDEAIHKPGNAANATAVSTQSVVA